MKKKRNLRFREPKTYKTKVRQELIKFIEIPERTVEQFCIACNDWLTKNGHQPVMGTPFEKDGHIYQFVRHNKWLLEKVR